MKTVKSMNPLAKIKEQLFDKGFSVVDQVFSVDEVDKILAVIDQADISNDTFRKSEELFAIRQFLHEVPETLDLILTENFKKLIRHIMGHECFLVKSIYFDKPPTSNWYVPYHQDITISVDRKIKLEGFEYWTTKQNQFAVQPPIAILENITTFRIHLDDTDEHNGALKVIPQSHQKKIYRPETINWELETEISCPVKKGGVMLMKPLTIHSSSRTTNNLRRRVIHIEIANIELPKALNWSERILINDT